MTARSDLLARALGKRFPVLDVIAMRRVQAFRVAADEACRVLGGVGAVVAAVGAYGELAGCRNPHAVLVSRLRWIVEDAAERRRLADEADEAARWAQVDRAAKRGETLRALVDRGELFVDEAVGMIAHEVPDEELRCYAMAALEGQMP
jgi:hypothetical protein